MSYKNLLVHLDMTKACQQRMETAAILAARHNAHLTGVFAPGLDYPPSWLQVTQKQVETWQKAWNEAYETQKDAFSKACSQQGLAYTTRFSAVSGDVVGQEVALHARYADMLIIGQPNPDDPGPLDLGGAGTATIGAGRPVLVLPYIGARTDNGGDLRLGRRVAVGWDAGREAARAVNDAMPILEKAERVDVTVVNPAKDKRKHGDEPGADIALHLARHGVEVNVHREETGDMEPGDTLLSRLSDFDSDLLVMGGYAHSRVQEFFMGGVTRTMLQHMTVPVLMSH